MTVTGHHGTVRGLCQSGVPCVSHINTTAVWCYAHQKLKCSVGSTASCSMCCRLCWQTFVKCSGTCSSLSSASLMPLSCRARQWSDLLVNTCLHSPCSPLPINTLRNNCFHALHQFIASSSSITSRNAQTLQTQAQAELVSRVS